MCSWRTGVMKLLPNLKQLIKYALNEVYRHMRNIYLTFPLHCHLMLDLTVGFEAFLPAVLRTVLYEAKMFRYWDHQWHIFRPSHPKKLPYPSVWTQERFVLQPVRHQVFTGTRGTICKDIVTPSTDVVREDIKVTPGNLAELLSMFHFVQETYANFQIHNSLILGY